MNQIPQRTTCRVCNGAELKNLFSLGDQFVSDFVIHRKVHRGIRCPLNLQLCAWCGLVQLEHTAPQELLYSRNYWYVSGTTQTMRDALRDVVECAQKLVPLVPKDVVLDIGSNDGTLLSYVPSFCYRVGCEPANNLQEPLGKIADYVIHDFWSCEAYGRAGIPTHGRSQEKDQREQRQTLAGHKGGVLRSEKTGSREGENSSGAIGESNDGGVEGENSQSSNRKACIGRKQKEVQREIDPQSNLKGGKGETGEEMDGGGKSKMGGRDNPRGSETETHSEVQGLAQSGVKERQSHLRDLQREKIEDTRRSHKAVHSVSEVKNKGIERPDALSELPQQARMEAQKTRQQVEGPKAKIIFACGMFYDLEDPNAFIRDVAAVLHEDGVFVAQLTCLKNMMDTNDIGNICHEHLEYYSLQSLQYLYENNGLQIFDVETNAVNGRSYRIYAKLQRSRLKVPRHCTDRLFEAMRIEERELSNASHLWDWWHGLEDTKRDVIGFLVLCAVNNKTVALYGASTKGNTILQWLGVDTRLVKFAIDRSPSKEGLYTIGTGIPIVSEVEGRARMPDFCLALPWAFREEFIEREQDYAWRKAGGKFVFITPKFEVI